MKYIYIYYLKHISNIMTELPIATAIPVTVDAYVVHNVDAFQCIALNDGCPVTIMKFNNLFGYNFRTRTKIIQNILNCTSHVRLYKCNTLFGFTTYTLDTLLSIQN